jgi:hypothetical protein
MDKVLEDMQKAVGHNITIAEQALGPVTHILDQRFKDLEHAVEEDRPDQVVYDAVKGLRDAVEVQAYLKDVIRGAEAKLTELRLQEYETTGTVKSLY